MLEKSPCKILVSKMRAIILFEAYFNDLYKIIFNQRILLALEKYNLIPMEIVDGRKSPDVIHVAINKKLISDISDQVKILSLVTSANATNFYDIVAHSFASLTAQHFGVKICYIIVLLQEIQSMVMFHQISFGI